MKTRSEPSFPHRKCWPIVRPPATGSVTVHPLAPRHTIVVIHRVDGRTVPCLDDHCPFCEAMLRSDERIFFPALRLSDRTHVLVDLPIGHHDVLVGVALRYGSLRTRVIDLSRSKPFANAPIVIKGAVASGELQSIPDFRGLVDELALVWTKNTEYALDCIIGEKTVSKFCAGREIGGRRDS